MNQPKTFSELFLGEMTTHEWAFHTLLVFLGVILYVLLRVKHRKNQDVEPSVKLWFNDIDNIIAIFISFILSYISIRFYSNYQDALVKYLPEGFKATPYFMMILVGFGQHKVSEWLGTGIKVNKI